MTDRIDLTMIVPRAVLGRANQFALLASEGPPDVQTFRAAVLVAGDRQRYSFSDLRPCGMFKAIAAADLSGPEKVPNRWGPDVNAAQAVQQMLVVWDSRAEGRGLMPVPAPERVLALIDAGPGVFDRLGLVFAPCAHLNRDTAERIAKLPGVGPALASEIVTRRVDVPWADPTDLAEIGGISPAMVKEWLADPGLSI